MSWANRDEDWQADRARDERKHETPPRPARPRTEREAVANLVGYCESICGNGSLGELVELGLRQHIAQTLAAFKMPSSRLRAVAPKKKLLLELAAVNATLTSKERQKDMNRNIEIITVMVTRAASGLYTATSDELEGVYLAHPDRNVLIADLPAVVRRWFRNNHQIDVKVFMSEPELTDGDLFIPAIPVPVEIAARAIQR